MAALILSIATILLSFVIRKSSIGKFVAYLGFATGIMDLLGAFPWFLTNTLVFLKGRSRRGYEINNMPRAYSYMS